MLYRNPRLVRRYYRAAIVIMCVVLVAVLTPISAPAVAQNQSQNPVTILWIVGLETGTGTQDQQVAVEKKVVQEFNDTIGKQDNITLEFQIAADDNHDLERLLCYDLAAGNAPDIIGPLGFSVGQSTTDNHQPKGPDICSFADYWLDLKPFLDKNHYDLTAYDPTVLDLYKTPDGGYSALPFAIYPTVLYYNTALFDSAGLNYPPTTFGEKYTMPDGSKVDWNYDTLAKLAKMLTFDKNGNAATRANFDPDHIVQYGVNFQWELMRKILSDIQPSRFYDPLTGKVSISADWRTAAHWVWNGLWQNHFISTATAEASPLFMNNGSGSAFNSGHIAMAIIPLWYTCCMTYPAGKLKWNIAVIPQSLDGQYHNAADADTFRIFKTTKHPDAAFTVLTYLLDNAVPELAPTYGFWTFPAHQAYRQTWLDGENKIYPQGVDWTVVTDSLKYTNPAELHHESNLPHFQQVQDRFASFYTLLFGDTGATIDVDKEMDKLQTDLNSIVEGTPVPTPTPVPTATLAGTPG